MLKTFINKRFIPVIFTVISSLLFVSQLQGQVPFSLRQSWDGPYDIRMIAAPNLDPVYLNPTQAASDKILADSLIPYSTMLMSGDLFEINNRYKGGSPFVQMNIPLQAILCNDPVNGCGTLGLTKNSPNGTCGTERYNNPTYITKDISMTYADYDDDLTTYSSSMAELDISSCSEIEAAYLYWTGMYQGGNDNITLMDGSLNSYSGSGNVFNTSSSSGFETVKFKIPGGAYQNVTALPANIRSVDSRYLCIADVTSIVQGTGGGQFWVGNVQSYPNEGGGGSTSGWNLVVIFRSPLSPPRVISLFDGLESINGGSTQIQLTGLTAPSTSNFKSYVGFAALDGENIASQLDGATPEGLGFQTNNGGAYFEINPFETDQPHYKLWTKKGYPGSCDGDYYINEDCKVPLFDAGWCTVYDGISSSHITSYDEATDLNGNEIVRLPSNKNTLGFDSHHMKLPNGSVAPGATTATLTVHSGPQGGTNPYLAYIAIERLQPKLDMTKFADKNTTELNAQITYTIRVKNLGNYQSLGGDIIYDTLDAATNFVGGSFTATSYVNGVATTPAANVSLFSSAGDNLEIHLDNSIARGDSVDILFTVDVLNYADNPALFDAPSCKRTIENTAYIDYNTISSGILQSKSNANDCGIGPETKVSIVDTDNLPPATVTNLGPFDGCSIAGNSILDRIRQELQNAGVPSSELSEWDIRDSNYVRVQSGDVFLTLTGSVVYLALREGGATCQEIYEVEFECIPCPTVDAGEDTTICASVTSIPLHGSVTVVTTGTWSTSGSGTFADANDLNTTYSPSATDKSNGTVTLTLTPGSSGCATPPTDQKIITINPAPAVTSSATGTICSGIAQNYTITSDIGTATFSWDRAAVTNISNAAVAGQTTNPITETLTNTSTSPIVVSYVITPTASGCAGTAFNYDVTVNPTPAITSSNTGTVCSGEVQNYDITSSVGSATFSWSRAAVTNISNAAVTGQIADPITETLTNTSTSPVVVKYVITPTASGCTGITFDYDVTVNPTPVVSSAATGTICSGVAQNYDITSNAGSVTFTWDRAAVTNISNTAATGQTADPITEVLTNTSTSPVVVRYIITPVASGCTGSAFNYDVTVNPVPVITSAATGTICSGEAQSYDITSNTLATFSWGRASVTNISNAAVTTQTADPIMESLINTGISPVVVRYVITPTASGCIGTAFNFDVTVDPAPSVTSVATGTTCSGVAQGYDITSNIGSATFSWDRAAVADISNAAISGQSADPITETLMNTGTDPIVVRYVITPTAGAGCPGIPFNYDVTVNPIPSVSSSATGTVCSGQAQNYNILSNVTSATFTWDRAAVADISNVAVSGQSADPITETLTNTGTAPIVVRYVITPDLSGCQGSAFNYDVTVAPSPSVTSVATGTICSGVVQSYDITSDIGSATFSWDRAAVVNISNVAVNGQTADPITETLINSGTSPVVVRYVITPTASGCAGTTFNYDVTVDPAPSVTSSATGTVCSGIAQNYDISCNIGSATFTWDRAAVTNISNATVSGQTADPVTETLINTGTGPAIVRYVITPIAAGCVGTPFNYDVSVVSPPINTQTVSGSQVCLGSDGTVTVSGTESGITYQAFIGTTPASLAGNGNGGDLVLAVNASSLSIGDNTISIEASGCSNTTLTNTATIQVTAIPMANAGPDIKIEDFTTVVLDGSGSSTGAYNYLWTSADPDVFINTPIAISTTVEPQSVSTNFILTVSDAGNPSCSSSDVVNVRLSPKPVEIPNVFSPNSDDIHDVLLIKNLKLFPNAILSVYNQWGELIYQSDPGYPEPWDGTRNGTPVPVSAYYYTLQLNEPEFEDLSGSITIIK